MKKEILLKMAPAFVILVSLIFVINPFLFVNDEIYNISGDVFFILRTLMLMFLLYVVLKISHYSDSD